MLYVKVGDITQNKRCFIINSFKLELSELTCEKRNGD